MTSEQMQKQNQEQVKALGKNYERSAIEVITPHDAPDHIACLGIAVHDGPHGELEKMCTCLSPFVFTAVVVTPDAVITDGLKKRFDSVVRVDSKNTARSLIDLMVEMLKPDFCALSLGVSSALEGPLVFPSKASFWVAAIKSAHKRYTSKYHAVMLCEDSEGYGLIGPGRRWDGETVYDAGEDPVKASGLARDQAVRHSVAVYDPEDPLGCLIAEAVVVECGGNRVPVASFDPLAYPYGTCRVVACVYSNHGWTLPKCWPLYVLAGVFDQSTFNGSAAVRATGVIRCHPFDLLPIVVPRGDSSASALMTCARIHVFKGSFSRTGRSASPPFDLEAAVVRTRDSRELQRAAAPDIPTIEIVTCTIDDSLAWCGLCTHAPTTMACVVTCLSDAVILAGAGYPLVACCVSDTLNTGNDAVFYEHDEEAFVRTILVQSEQTRAATIKEKIESDHYTPQALSLDIARFLGNHPTALSDNDNHLLEND